MPSLNSLKFLWLDACVTSGLFTPHKTKNEQFYFIHTSKHAWVDKASGATLTFVGNGNLEGSVLQGVWMAVSGGGHDWVISWIKKKKKTLRKSTHREKMCRLVWVISNGFSLNIHDELVARQSSYLEKHKCVHTLRISSTQLASPVP